VFICLFVLAAYGAFYLHEHAFDATYNKTRNSRQSGAINWSDFVAGLTWTLGVWNSDPSNPSCSGEYSRISLQYTECAVLILVGKHETTKLGGYWAKLCQIFVERRRDDGR